MFGRQLDIHEKLYKYKLIDYTRFGILERIVVSLVPIDLTEPKSDLSIKVFPISIKRYTTANQEYTTGLFIKSISALIEELTGEETIPMIKYVFNTLMDSCDTYGLFDLKSRIQALKEYVNNISVGLSVGDESLLMECININTIDIILNTHYRISKEYSFDTKDNEIIERLIEHIQPIFKLLSPDDKFSLRCIQQDYIAMDNIKAWSKLSCPQLVLPHKDPFEGKPFVYNLNKGLREEFSQLIKYLKDVLYTDISFDISVTKIVNVEFLISEYGVYSDKIFVLDIVEIFEPIFEYHKNISKITCVKLTTEELFITIHYVDHTIDNIYIDLVLYSIATPTLL